MSPLSSDEEKRARQLANLRRGETTAPTANRRAESHGAYSALTRAELDGKLAEIHKALAIDAPVREADGGLPAADGPAVRMAAEALCRLDRIAEFLDRRGWEDDNGKPRPVLEYEARLRAHSLELLRDLGMTPAARAKLGVDLVRMENATEDAAAARAARERLDQRLDSLDADAEEVAGDE